MQDSSSLGGSTGQDLLNSQNPQSSNSSSFTANQSSDFQNAAPVDTLNQAKLNNLQVSGSGVKNTAAPSQAAATNWGGWIAGFVIITGVVILLAVLYRIFMKPLALAPEAAGPSRATARTSAARPAAAKPKASTAKVVSVTNSEPPGLAAVPKPPKKKKKRKAPPGRRRRK